MILYIFPYLLLFLQVQSQVDSNPEKILVEPNPTLICKPIACLPVNCTEGFREVRNGCDCPKCERDEPSTPKPSIEGTTGCRIHCGEHTRLVQDPTRCHNPRCVADGYTDEWEKPGPPGIVGLCLQEPNPPIDCGNGTIQVQEKSTCGCPKCIPINETVSTDHCPDPPSIFEVICDEGMKPVKEPGCNCPKCVPELQLAPITIKPVSCHPPLCFKGYHLASRPGFSCPICVPDDPSSESARLPDLPDPCEPCEIECGPGTRLVTDPTKCKSPKCVAKRTSSQEGIDDEEGQEESARLPGLPKICDPPASSEVQCGRGTKKMKKPGRCECAKCVPLDSPSTESLTNSSLLCEPIACPQVLCPVGTVRVIDPTGCSCPKCIAEEDCNSSAPPSPPCKPLICSSIFCEQGAIKVEDPLGCKCPTCFPVAALQYIETNSNSINCKHLCPLLRCPQGEPAHKFLCDCPKCEAIGPVNVTLPVKRICDIVCPQIKCAPGYFPHRPQGVDCACPRCIPNLVRPPRCNGLVCPEILCAANSVRLEDPLGCRYPICHTLPDGESHESIQVPIQCKFICPQIQCPPGQSPHKNPTAVCACPQCLPDNLPPPSSILNGTICEFACPPIKCPAGQLPLRDHRVQCGCPKCHPIPTPCLVLPCPHVECPVGNVKLEDPQGCRCPICHNITDEEADESLIGAGILCDFICKPPTCPPGYFPQRDPHHACGCKHCVLQTDLKIVQQLTFDYACPSCAAGTFPYSDPDVRRGCPVCVPLNSTLTSCQPRICPEISCDNGTIKLEDPEGCRCPICHRPAEPSQENILQQIPFSCKFVCIPPQCPPGQVARKDPKYVCGCPKCYPTNGLINQIWDKIVCKFACPPLICPAGQVPTRTGKMCQCPICAPINSTLPSCQPRMCPEISCDNGTIKLEDPEGCRCPICHRPAEPSQEDILQQIPILCKFVCIPPQCPPGQVARRDPRFVCGCPRCFPDDSITHIIDEISCKFACPPVNCPAGQVPTRFGKGCQCPVCAPLNSTLPSCQPRTCPEISCDNGTIKLEDPEGCRCPICHRPAELSQENILQQIPILCKFICIPPQCPPGQVARRDPRFVCGCPRCVPDDSITHIIDEISCKFACPPVNCPAGQVPTRFGKGCQCPVCAPLNSTLTSCQPRTCPEISCDNGTIKLEDPEGCRCPICHRPAEPSQENILQQIPILCKFICIPPQCPPGQVARRDPRFVCGCPRCVPDDSITHIIDEISCKFACPPVNCPAGQVPTRFGKGCQCPVCAPLNSTLTSCQPRTCPEISCDNGTIKLEDPEGCRCPICHRPAELSQENILQQIPILCKFICIPPQCPPGQVARRDPRFVCGCPRCVPDDSITHIIDEISCKFACPPVNCPAGQVPTRFGKGCQCPVCAPLNSTLTSCQPRTCPEISCDNGTIKLEDPEGCRCPICHRPAEPSQENILQQIPILCKFICIPPQCPPGQVARRDPRFVCGCPRCVPDDSITHIIDEISCKFACPPVNCPAGQVPTRFGKGCQCPVCAPLNSTLPSCQPRTCPEISCDNGTIKLEDPEGCRCPICHRPAELSQEDILQQIPILCKFACIPPQCPPGQVARRDPRFVCGCPRCFPDDSITHILDDISCKFACLPVNCPAGQVPIRFGKSCQCPVCAPLIE